MGDLELFEIHKSGSCFVGGCSPSNISPVVSAPEQKCDIFHQSNDVFMESVGGAAAEKLQFLPLAVARQETLDKESQQQPLPRSAASTICNKVLKQIT